MQQLLGGPQGHLIEAADPVKRPVERGVRRHGEILRSRLFPSVVRRIGAASNENVIGGGNGGVAFFTEKTYKTAFTDGGGPSAEEQLET